MRRVPKDKTLIEFEEIKAIVRKILAIRMSRTSIYFYIKEHSFPCPIGLGRPRKWDRLAVLAWVEKRVATDQAR